ncbi:serine hydrolase domain-containing protein [Ekhidna sp.]
MKSNLDKTPILFLSLILIFASSSKAQSVIKKIDDTDIAIEALDKKIQSLQKEANVHGLTISIITRDEILFQKAYGARNIKEDIPLKISDNFYGASLSKPLFAYIVMNLAEERIIDLDKPLVEYLDKPLSEYKFQESYEGYQDLANDSRRTLITARMCLSHSSGLPNWRYIGKYGINMEKELEIEFSPGSYYSYSGEGIQLLQFVIEQVSGKPLEELAKKYVFEPFGMNMSSFVWQEKFEGNYAVGHFKKKKVLGRKKRNREYAAGSMETTPQDYARFIQAMLNNGNLSKESFEEMTSSQIEITSTQQFGTNRFKNTEANKDIELSYGLGWGIYTTPYGKAVFKEGHISGWEHYTAFYPENNIAIILMTNSSNGESVFKEILEIAIGDSWLPWYWQNYFPYNHEKSQ